jgi:hypothetical protein
MIKMLTEDYLIRRINQAIALLLHALGLRQNGQLEAALTDIDIALELLLGMRSVLLKEMDDPSLLQLLTVRGEVDMERLVLVVNLFKEEGAIFELEGRAADSNRDYLRALNFLLVIAQDEKVGLSADQIADIELLRQKLQIQRLPLDTQAALLDYYQWLLEFDDARLVEVNINRAEIEKVLKEVIDTLSRY